MFTPPNVSRVTCHVSHVTCHVSRVTCHVSHVTCHIFFLFFGQSGEAYRWRVCYQWGLPRLVSNTKTKSKSNLLRRRQLSVPPGLAVQYGQHLSCCQGYVSQPPLSLLGKHISFGKILQPPSPSRSRLYRLLLLPLLPNLHCP